MTVLDFHNSNSILDREFPFLCLTNSAILIYVNKCQTTLNLAVVRLSHNAVLFSTKNPGIDSGDSEVTSVTRF